uniref:CID domain-containing protein n=1 Tax=Plectus sambesii TaxID=2011161 RepID=A0A914XLI4_9BILA
MATASDAAEEYRATLGELTNNNKTQINLLTILAEDYAQFAGAIVQVIDQQILQVPPGQKLAVMYVADSIIKNVDQKAKYRDLFGKSIVKTFVHVFDTGDEKTRMALYKLRLTWGDVFPRSKLYAIDIKVNQIDPAWPVLNPQTNSSAGSDSSAAATSSSHTAIHVNPRFLPSSKPTPRSGVSADEEKILRLQKQKEAQEAERNKLKAQIAEKERQIEGKNPRPQSVVTLPNDPRKAAKQLHAHEHAPPTVVNGQSSEADKNADRRSKAREDRVAPAVDDSNASSGRSDTKGRKDILERYRRESDDGSNAEGRKSSKRNRTDDRSSRNHRSRSPTTTTTTESTKKHQKSPVISEVERSRNSGDSSPSARRDSSDNHDSGKEKNLPPKKRVRSADMTEETSSGNESTDRSHAEGASAEKRPRPATHSPTIPLSTSVDKERAADDDGRKHSPNGGRYSRSGGQRRGGNRQQTASNAPRGGSRLKDHQQPASFEPTATPGQHAFIAAPMAAPAQTRFSGLLPTPPAAFTNAPAAHLPPVVPTPTPTPFAGYGAPTPSYPPATIITDQPKLEGIPANNRIFVDGKAYEVFYIDEVPVIERNGLPHRIYFTGPPRNVIIDGVAHSLAFGDKKTIIIDGQPHVVRYGAPSRELYMGDYPFRGAFGGPPIFATINGVRHEIRLGGPPPEVKIEPDPCYELLRHMPSRQAQPRGPLYDYGPTPPTQPMPVMSGHLAPASVPVQPQIDVGGLLERLFRKGVLTTPSTSLPTASPGQNEASRSPQQRPLTPPIPSQYQIVENEAIERRPQPPATLKDLNMRSMKIRYQSVIDALYQTQQRCPNCGLRFDDLKGEKYQRHLDWHFKENQRAQDSSRGVSRQWYFAVEDWINYTEQGEDPASKAKSDVFEEINSRVEDTETNVVASSSVTTVAASDMPGDQSCAVCNEKFEEYWDEDDDAWKFKDCMLADGKAYHPTCYQDVSVVPGHQDAFLPSAMDTSAFSGVPGLEITPPTPAIKDEPHGTPFELPTKSVPSDSDPVGLNNGLVMQVKEEPLSADSGFDSSPLPGLGPSSPPPRSPGTPLCDESALSS